MVPGVRLALLIISEICWSPETSQRKQFPEFRENSAKTETIQVSGSLLVRRSGESGQIYTSCQEGLWVTQSLFTNRASRKASHDAHFEAV